MKLPTYDVAVIGAGYTGSALAVELTRSMPAGSKILLLGAPKETGKGVAYGTEVALHLLNVRAGRMSMLHDDPSHFVRWLVAKDEGKTEDEIAEDYVPRALYGSYVLESLHQAILDAAGRVQVDLVEGTATEIVEDSGMYVVRAATGARYAARCTALCLGHGCPDFPVAADAIDPEARERMVADVWSDRRLGRIGRDDRVLFVGTGLTMVDQVLTLEARGHKGELVAISRRGHLPTGHLDRRTEPFAIDIPARHLTLRRLVRLVVAAARAEVAAGRDWRAVIDGLRPVTQDLWRRLDHADRRRFCRHVECVWSVVRHRMAPSVEARVDAARNSGRLTVREGRVVAVKRTQRGLTVGLRARGGRTVELAGFDWMVNCSGTGRIGAADQPPASLVSHGLVRPDPLGRGVEITTAGEALGRDGQPVRGLYALGPLGAGSLYEITAVPDIREQCSIVAGRIATLTRSARRAALPESAGRVPARLGT